MGETQAKSSKPRWQNWSANVSFEPDVLAVPRTLGELTETISRSAGQVRVVGSGHSFTSLAQTTDTLLSLEALPGEVLSIDVANSQATLNAGASLNRLSRALQEENLAFKNLGDIDVQSLAGATSTATHGTGSTLPCLSAEIAELGLITASGELLRIGATENAHLLPAAQVALGSLGVIVDATVNVRPAYKLHRKTFIKKLDATLAEAPSLWDRHRNYEFFYLPFCEYAFNITHDETDEADRRIGTSDDEAGLRDLRRLRTVLKRMSPLRRAILNQVARRTATEDVVGTSWELLANERNSKFNEMEYHLPVDTALDAMAEVIAQVEANPDVYFPVECRRTAGDSAWLSPFQGADRISIAVHIGEGDDYQWLFDAVEPILQRYGGRPHWGKLHSMTANGLRSLYPDFDRFLEVRRELDPTGRFLNRHTAALWGEKIHD